MVEIQNMAAEFKRGRETALALENSTRGTVVADQIRMADGLLSRGLGLMGHPGLSAGQALILQPESSIHMFFMRFPLDVLFLDADNRVLHLYEAIKPWRVSRVVRGSRRVVEMPPGSIAASGTQLGDQLNLKNR